MQQPALRRLWKARQPLPQYVEAFQLVEERNRVRLQLAGRGANVYDMPMGGYQVRIISNSFLRVQLERH